MGTPGSLERPPGSGTQWLDPRGGLRDFGPSGWMGSGLPRRSDARTWRGLSTPAPWKRNQRLPDIRGSGISTGGTRGPGLTGTSGIQEARRTVGSDGVDASTPMSEGMDWTRGGRVSRYSPIMVGQPAQSPPQRLKMPGMGTKRESTSPQGAGVPETVNSLGRQNLGLSGVPASRWPDRFTNTAVPRFDGSVCW